MDLAVKENKNTEGDNIGHPNQKHVRYYNCHIICLIIGIHENTADNPEALIKDFTTTQLKLPPDIVNQITLFDPGQTNSSSHHHQTAALQTQKRAVLIKSRGRELRGTKFGLNDQYLHEMKEQCKILFPIMKHYRQNNKYTVINVDKLYI